MKQAAAAAWAAAQHGDLLRSRPSFTVMAEASGPELTEALSAFPGGEVVILPLADFNPAAALCLRDLCSEPFVSHLGRCRRVLSAAVSALCSEARQAKREAREQRRAAWRKRRDEKRRLREEVAEGRTSPSLLRAFQWDQQSCPRPIREAGLHLLLPELRAALTGKECGLSEERSNELARKVAEQMARAGMHYERIKAVYLGRAGVRSRRRSGGEDDPMARIQVCLKAKV